MLQYLLFSVYSLCTPYGAINAHTSRNIPGYATTGPLQTTTDWIYTVHTTINTSLANHQTPADLHDCLQDDDARQSRTRGVKQVHLIQHHIRVQHLLIESRSNGGEWVQFMSYAWVAFSYQGILYQV